MQQMAEQQQRKYQYNAIHKYTENDLTKHAINTEYSEYVTSAKIVIHVNCNISKLLILQDLKQYNTFYSCTIWSPGVAENYGEPSNDHSFRLPQEQHQWAEVYQRIWKHSPRFHAIAPSSVGDGCTMMIDEKNGSLVLTIFIQDAQGLTESLMSSNFKIWSILSQSCN